MTSAAPSPPIELVKLQALVGFAEKRVARAMQRCASADHEATEAGVALSAANARLAAWLAANPDDQLGLFQPTTSGENL
jgi:uncharacterized membrane-anchored protein